MSRTTLPPGGLRRQYVPPLPASRRAAKAGPAFCDVVCDQARRLWREDSAAPVPEHASRTVLHDPLALTRQSAEAHLAHGPGRLWPVDPVHDICSSRVKFSVLTGDRPCGGGGALDG